jgi:hypothetical protein
MTSYSARPAICASDTPPTPSKPAMRWAVSSYRPDAHLDPARFPFCLDQQGDRSDSALPAEPSAASLLLSRERPDSGCRESSENPLMKSRTTTNESPGCGAPPERHRLPWEAALAWTALSMVASTSVMFRDQWCYTPRGVSTKWNRRRFMRGRKPRCLILEPEDVALLDYIARTRSRPVYQAQRAKLLLAMARGERVRVVAARTNCDASTVWRVCRRYETHGLDSVLSLGLPPSRRRKGSAQLLTFDLLDIGAE